LQNDNYAHEIKDIMNCKEDDYKILVYFNFHTLLVDTLLVEVECYSEAFKFWWIGLK